MKATRVLAVLAAFLLLSSTAFAVDVSAGANPDPVAFDDTVRAGMTGAATVQASQEGYDIPRVQVFYSQYRYVVGYYGVTSFVDELHRTGHERQFGLPLTAYVTTYSGLDVTVTPEGYVRTDRTPSTWIDVERAFFVVGSEARTPGGPTVVPFSSRADAEAFADAHGGRVETWEAVRELDFGTEQASREQMRRAVAARRAWANRTVADASPLADRPVSVVVGEDAPTLAAAVERAPPNTTVYLPAGSYEGNVTVRKPITVRGAGNDTVVRGDGESSVLTVRAPRVAVTDLSLTGVGDTKSVENISENRSGDWDYRVKLGYGYGDAGVAFDSSNESLVRNVTVHTPANGVLVRYSEGVVVDNATVYGADQWVDGFMGVMVMESRVVVQRSTFHGGRDGVYTHLGHGSVVRHSEMDDMRFGVHQMYTSDMLTEDNTVRGTNVGIVIMTRPSNNTVVGNDVRDAGGGISVAGGASYVADNVLVDNTRYGLDTVSRRSLYEHNVVVGNAVGVRASTLIPTNRVVANDFAGNDRYAVAILGPLRVYPGNYWLGAPGRDADGDGRLDRSFYPTGPVDGRVDRADGAPSLARSPALATLRALQDSVPGLRATGVLDDAPRARPVRPETLGELNATATEAETR
ncbi:MAG: NosD domain-containing protein [Haloferacaceae archaeon]